MIIKVNDLCIIPRKIRDKTVWYLPLPSHITNTITFDGSKYRSAEMALYGSSLDIQKAAIFNAETLANPDRHCSDIMRIWLSNMRGYSVKLIFGKEFAKESQLLNIIKILQECDNTKCFIEIANDNKQLVSNLPSNMAENILVFSDQVILRHDIPVLSYTTEPGIEITKFYPEKRIPYSINLKYKIHNAR